MSLWNAVCSVHLCFSVRKRTHPLDEIITTKVAGEFLLSQRVFLSLTELTDLTELIHQRFDPTERLRHTEFTEASPPTPLRMERGVVCEVTPTGLLNRWRTCRGISVFTPLSIRRGAGGEARERPSSFENMPFLHVEDALLGARRACSQTLSVTF